MILEITASANGGFCGSCVKTQSVPETQAVFTSNRARLYGEEDGGCLRRGEITVSDIPTHKVPWMGEMKAPNVTCSRG